MQGTENIEPIITNIGELLPEDQPSRSANYLSLLDYIVLLVVEQALRDEHNI